MIKRISSRQGKASPLLIGLISAIGIAVVILAVVVFTQSGDSTGKTPDPNRSPTPTPTPPPHQLVDTSRLVETYVPGRTYQSLVAFQLDGRASNKDYGITVDMNFHYLGEVQVDRTIESNDGKTIVVREHFVRAQMLDVATNIDNLKFGDLDASGKMALGFVDWVGNKTLDLPNNWTNMSLTGLNLLANTGTVRNVLSQVATDKDAKVWAYVDSLQGKTVRITYVNGQGIVGPIEPIDCVLSDAEQNVVKTSAVIADMYWLPDVKCKPGDKWIVNAEDVMPVIDPSLHAHLEGALTAIRGSNGGTTDDPTATVDLESGSHLELRANDDARAYYGYWTPSGSMLYSFKEGVVTSGTLGGSFNIESRSTNHWIFEAKFVAQPSYKVTYSCKVLK